MTIEKQYECNKYKSYKSNDITNKIGRQLEIGENVKGLYSTSDIVQSQSALFKIEACI